MVVVIVFHKDISTVVLQTIDSRNIACYCKVSSSCFIITNAAGCPRCSRWNNKVEILTNSTICLVVGRIDKDNLNALALKEKARKAQEQREREAAEENARRLKDVVVTVRARAGANGKLFGSVTSQEICDALSEQHGIVIEKNRLVQGDPIKTYGNYEVRVKFGYGIDGTVNLMVIEK